ncbi:MAG TPA: hypothetical protein VLK22_03510 [Candidatus Udaeobacter sp.]|nr:hypothetical protein [Candidatus Udaeobacter sp.]
MLNIYNPNNHDGDKTVPILKNGAVNHPAGVDFTKYEDPNKEFTSQELKWGFWYVKNKAFLNKFLLIILIGINAVLVFFSLWRWGSYFLDWQNSRQTEANLAAGVNYTGLQAHFSAQPIQAVNTQIFPSRSNKYDAVAELINPNSRFLATFNYYFIIDGEKTPLQKTFLLPGENRLVTYLGIKNGTGGTPTIVLENIEYQRISAHEVPDAVSWQAYRLNFKVSDFVFLKSLAQEGINTDAIQFKLTNASPYNYAAPDFYVALMQNGQMVGVLPLHLDSIKSLETKDIDLRYFFGNLNISEIALYPIINVYDKGAYLAP